MPPLDFKVFDIFQVHRIMLRRICYRLTLTPKREGRRSYGVPGSAPAGGKDYTNNPKEGNPSPDRKSILASLRQHGAAFTIVVATTQAVLFVLVYGCVVSGLDRVLVRAVDSVAYSAGLITAQDHFSSRFEASLQSDSTAAKGGRAAAAVILFSTLPSAVVTVPWYVFATPIVSRAMARSKWRWGGKA